MDALRDHRAVLVVDDEGGEHFVEVTRKPLPKLVRHASLAALEQVGGPEYDFRIELPRREVWSAEVILDD
jgi:hypothetical protein